MFGLVEVFLRAVLTAEFGACRLLCAQLLISAVGWRMWCLGCFDGIKSNGFSLCLLFLLFGGYN